MKRKQVGVGLAFALLVVFFAALNRLDGNPTGQIVAAVVYAITMLGLLRWTNRARLDR